MNEYDDSLEFQELLRSYEKLKQQGKAGYFDSDDYVDIAEHYMQNDRLSEALDVADEGLRLHADDVALLSIKTNVLISLMRFDEARQILDRITPDDDPDVYYFRGQLACADGEAFGVRSDWFHRWMDIERTECDEMTNSHDAEGRLKEAYMHVVLSIVDLSPEDNLDSIMTEWVDEYISRCTFQTIDDSDLDIARACHDVSLYEKEIELYKLFLDVDPYLKGGYTYLASLYSMINEHDEAINSAEFALAIDQDDTQALLVKALGHYQLSDYEQATIDFGRYIKKTSDSVYYAVLASCLMHIGRKDEALAYLLMARDYTNTKMRDADMKAGSRAFMADVYMQGGYYDEALKQMNAVLRHKRLPEFVIQKGIILLAQDKLGAAMRTFLEAIGMAERKFPYLMVAGGELMSRGYLDVAMLVFSLAGKCKDDPDYPIIYIYLAQGYYLKQSRAQFLKYLQKACTETPEMVHNCWHDELIGVAPADYFATLKGLLDNKMTDHLESGFSSSNARLFDFEPLIDLDGDMPMPF